MGEELPQRRKLELTCSHDSFENKYGFILQYEEFLFKLKKRESTPISLEDI